MRIPRLRRRTMKFIHYLLVTFLTFCVCGCSPVHDNDILFQTSTINALLEGIYNGDVTYRELKQRGDFGIGTFNALDGEMLGFDNKFYQIKADGIAYRVDDCMKTPFAIVTYFEPDKTVLLDNDMDYDQLKYYLDSLLPTKNIFYAVKIDGIFRYIKTRSVPRQTKPYPPLVEVVKNQPTFEFQNVEGTIVGFRCPSYVKGINIPGYHLHFITKDKKGGGHLLECRTQNMQIEIDYTSEFFMVLAESDEFYKTDLTKEKQKELEKVEK